jgi:hypothetical protein
MIKFKFENIKLKRECDAGLLRSTVNYTIKSEKCHQNLKRLSITFGAISLAVRSIQFQYFKQEQLRIQEILT